MVKTTVKIDGMACTMCEAHIKDVIYKIEPSAKKVKASHTAGEASFVTEAPVDKARLQKAIDDTGYRCVSFDTQPYENRGIFGLFKK